MIPVDGCPRAVWFEGQWARAPHAVAVRVGSEDEVAADRFCVVDCCIEDGRIFGIANVSRNVWKIAIWGSVRSVGVNVFEAGGFEKCRYDESADTVQG